MNPIDDQKQMVKVRDYLLNTYGKDYGIKDADIGWDGQNVTLKGDVLFKPAYVQNGRSYLDQGTVDNSMQNYFNMTGMKPRTNYQSMSYQSPYAEQIKTMYDQIVNAPKFDPNSIYDTPEYSALESKYKRLGDTAMGDTMAQASSMTGGRLNSWATSAASQAKNSYNQQFTNLIPQMQANARANYDKEMNQRMGILDMLMGMDNTEYGRWSDDLNFDYGVDQDQKNWDYQLGRDADEAEWRQKEWDYGVSQDQLDESWRQKEWDYNVAQDKIANALSWARLNDSGGGPSGKDDEKVVSKDPTRPLTGSIVEIPAQTRADIETAMAEMMNSFDPQIWYFQNEPYLAAAFGEGVLKQFRAKLGLPDPKVSASQITKEAFKSRQLE